MDWCPEAEVRISGQRGRSPLNPVDSILEEPWGIQRTHIIVTADALAEDARGISDGEKDNVAEFPVATMLDKLHFDPRRRRFLLR